MTFFTFLLKYHPLSGIGKAWSACSLVLSLHSSSSYKRWKTTVYAKKNPAFVFPAISEKVITCYSRASVACAFSVFLRPFALSS